MKVIIVGGVAGGMSAATRLRRLDEKAEIIVVEKGPYVSFANCGLPYHLSGEIVDRESLVLQTPDKLKARFNLNVRTQTEVVKINPTEQTIVLKHGQVETVESYDKLILSPGANPLTLPIEGLGQASNTYTLRNVPDLDEMVTALEDSVRQAVVIGAGFIGLEVAENLHHRGIQVVLVEKAPHVLPPLDEEVAAYIREELESKGIEVLTNQAAIRFENDGKKIVLDSGRSLSSDLTVLSVGIQPASELAVEAGLEVGLRGAIVVNEQYQTSDPNIYAVGDAIVVKHQISGKDVLISLASPANRQGRQVADVLAGVDRINQGSIGTSIVRVFGLAAATTGLNERTAQQLGLEHKVVHISGKNHASYYPGAADIILKLIFNPITAEIYGAQAVGANGVDKRIDVLATAIKAGLTVHDLPELELTYAPPFGSAKDPVNMIGYAALNVIEGYSNNIQWHELDKELEAGRQLIDVRECAEIQQGYFPDYLHIPLNQLRNWLSQLDINQSYVVSCHSGQRSYIAERIMKQHGFDVVNLDGAFSLYRMVRPDKLVYPNVN